MNIEPMHVFDICISNLIEQSERHPIDDFIDEAIEALICCVKAGEDPKEKESYLFDIIGAAINQQFEEGVKAGVQFMCVALTK